MDTDNTPKTVSAASACWALIALSWNAAFIPSGADHYPDDHISPAMTSPFICAADILVCCSWVLYGVLNGLTIVEAAKLFIQDFDISNKELKIWDRKTPMIMALIMLNVGALSQAVKLFGLRDVPWVQTLAAALFLVAPLVRYALYGLAKQAEAYHSGSDYQNGRRYDKLREWKPYLCRMRFADMIYSLGYVVQLHLLVACFYTPRSSSSYHAISATYSLVALLAIVRFAIGPLLEVSSLFPHWKRAWDSNRSRGFIRIVATSPTFITFLLTCIIYNSHPFSGLRARSILFQLSLLSTFWQFGAVMVEIQRAFSDRTPPDSSTFHGLQFRWNPLLSFTHNRPRLRKLLSWIFAVSNLIMISLYYGFVYNCEGTIKPGWTEYLG